jgi:hypothetical protein
VQVAEPVPLAFSPGLHGTHEVAPARENVPGAHALQLEPPATGLKDPDGQFVHSLELAIEILPASHFRHSLALSSEYVPAAH